MFTAISFVALLEQSSSKDCGIPQPGEIQSCSHCTTVKLGVRTATVLVYSPLGSLHSQ